MFQSSQRLRQRMEAIPKRIAPRPLGDASVQTERVRFANSVRTNKPQTAGSMLVLSSEFVTSGHAQCAVCQNPPQDVYVQTDCCGLPSTNPPGKPLALQGRCTTVCPQFNFPQPVLPSNNCCTNTHNTAWANNLQPGSRGLYGQVPAIGGCTVCNRGPATTVRINCGCTVYPDISNNPVVIDPCTQCLQGAIPPASAYSLVTPS
jgi:hypothetical protein